MQMLPAYFKRATGTDPSQKMIEEARRSSASTESTEKLDYVISGAEDLPSHFPANTFDMVTAGM